MMMFLLLFSSADVSLAGSMHVTLQGVGFFDVKRKVST